MTAFPRSIAVRLIALIAAICTLSWSAAQARNGTEEIGMTAQQLGRGGAFIAAPPESGALFGNPAALAFLDKELFSLDLRFTRSDLGYEGALHARSAPVGYVVPVLTYAGPWGRRMAWGVGLANDAGSTGVFNRYDLSVFGLPPGTTDRLSSRTSLSALTPAVAWRITRRTAIGAELSAGIARAKTNVLGETIGRRTDNLSGFGYSWRAGVYHRLSPRLTAGAYWRGRTHLRLKGGRVTYGEYTSTPGASISGVQMRGMSWPEQYGVGIAASSGRSTLLAEYRRLNWSEAMSTITLTVPGGEDVRLPVNWRDQDVWVLGWEHRMGGCDCEVWRAGLNYAKSCVPDSALLQPALNELHLTCGYERQLRDGLRLTTALVFSPRHAQRSTPDSDYNLLLGGGEPFSVSNEGLVFAAGLSWTLGGGRGEEGDAQGPSDEETGIRD